MALLPPPTQATTASGRRPSASSICALISSADDALEIAHHARIGRRPGGGAEDVKRRLQIGHPIAKRFIDGIFQRAAAAGHRHDFRAQQAHAKDVERLSLHIFRAHVDRARHAEQRGDGRGGHAVLPGAGFGDETRFAHAPRQQRLPQHVIQFMRAGMAEVFAFQIDGRRRHNARSSGRRGRASWGD